MSYTRNAATLTGTLTGTPGSPQTLAVSSSATAEVTVDTLGTADTVAGVLIVVTVTIGSTAPTVAPTVQPVYTLDGTNWINDYGPFTVPIGTTSASYSYQYQPPPEAIGGRMVVTNGDTSETVSVWAQANTLGDNLEVLSGKTSIISPASTAIPLVVQGAPSQTANLQEWQDSAGTAVAVIDSSGNLSFPTLGGGGTVYFSNNVAPKQQFIQGTGNAVTIQATSTIALNAGAVSMGGQLWANGGFSAADFSPLVFFTRQSVLGTSDYVLQMGDGNGLVHLIFAIQGNQSIFYASAAASKGLVVQGAASQTANLQEWQDSSGSVLASVSSNGTFTLNTTIHPITIDSNSGGTTTLDLSVTDEHATTLSADTTFAFSNAMVGQRFTLRIAQAASGVPYTAGWPSGITWFTSTFTAPTMPTGAGNAMVVTFKVTGTGTYDGFLAGTSGT